MKSIASADNVAFKRWLRLVESPREVRTQRRTLAEGVHLAEAIHASGRTVEAVLLRRGAEQVDACRWADRYIAAGVPGYELAATLFDRLAPVERGTGLLLLVVVPEPAALEVADALLLDGVQDPGNAGALLRVAAAAGIRNVLATSGTVALWAPKVLRGAQGAHFGLHIVEDVLLDRLTQMLPIPWVGAAAHGGTALWNVDLTGPALGFMVGSEGAGLSAAAVAACGRLVTIPLAAGVESLNVTAAAAVFLFERRRQVDGDCARLLPLA